MVPSSRITLSPKTFTWMAPWALSTSRVSISRIAFDLALMSIAQIPRMTGERFVSWKSARSSLEAIEEREEDLVTFELERGD